jgi:hypothetical protein
MKSSRKTALETKSSRGEKDTTLSPTANGHLVAYPAASNKPSGWLKLTGKGSGNVSVPAASMEAAKRRTSSNPIGEVSGPQSDAPLGTTATTAQVQEKVSPREKRNKIPMYVSGVRNKRVFVD